MRELAKLVEQLDLASDLLRQGSPTGARLALLLTDNVVELLAHQRCAVLLREDARGPRPEANRWAAHKASRVLGNKFTPKVSFLRERGELEPDEALLATFAHRMRNEAYHSGLVHEPVIRAIAFAYFQLGCSVLGRLRNRWFFYNRTAGPPAAIAKHLPPKFSRRFPGSEALNAATASLAASVPKPDRTIGGTLRAAILQTLTELQDLVSYFVRGHPEVRSVREAIGHVQFWDALFEQAPFRIYSIQDPVQATAWTQRRQEMRAWRPSVNGRTLRRWQKRAQAIATQSPPGNALQRYLTLRKEIQPFERAVKLAVASLDEEIERQIDADRERR